MTSSIRSTARRTSPARTSFWTSFAGLLKTQPFGARQRISTYRKIGQLVDNGVPVTRALEYLIRTAAGRARTRPLARVYRDVHRRYTNGQNLGQAFSAHVPQVEAMLLSAGEQSGRLTEVLKNTVDITTAAQRINAAVISGSAYPLLLLTSAIGVLWFFSIRVIPQFADLLPTDQWTGAAAFLAAIASVVEVATIPAVILMLAGTAAIVASMPYWTGPIRTRLDALPPWSFYRLKVGTGFMISVAALINSGMPVHDILPRLRRNATPWLAERLRRTEFWLNEGQQNLGDALARAGFGFPDPEIVADLRIYASLTNLDESIQLIAREWLDESVRRVNAQANILNGISLVVLAGVAISIGFGLFSILSQTTQALNTF